MTRAGIREETGIVAQRQRDRATYGRYAYRAPVCLPDAPKLEPLPEPVDPPTLVKAEPPLPKIVEPWPKPPVNKGGRPRVFEPDPRYTVRAILEAVSEAYGVTLAELLNSRYRPQRLALPRFAVSRLLRDKRNLSYPNIGRALGQDHSTAIHGCKRASGLLESDPEWTAAYRAAEHALCRP